MTLATYLVFAGAIEKRSISVVFNCTYMHKVPYSLSLFCPLHIRLKSYEKCDYSSKVISSKIAKSSLKVHSAKYITSWTIFHKLRPICCFIYVTNLSNFVWVHNVTMLKYCPFQRLSLASQHDCITRL